MDGEKKCCVGKGDNFGRFVGVVDGKGNIAIDGRGDVVAWKIDQPQIGVTVTPTCKDGSIGVRDGNHGVGEDCFASCVTSWPMERREVLPSAGKRCAWHADGGS